MERIRLVHEPNYRSYVRSRRIWKTLRREGVEVGRCRVERLMRSHGITSIRGGKRWKTAALAAFAHHPRP